MRGIKFNHTLTKKKITVIEYTLLYAIKIKEKIHVNIAMMIKSIYNGLDETDKQSFEFVLKKNGLEQDEINEIYDGKQVTDFIAYQNLSREDKITICILLIKPLLLRKGSFSLTPDHYVWLASMLKFPPDLGDHRCEREIYQFITITNYIHFQHLSKGEYMIDLILQPLTSMCGAAISGFCVYPLIESICRRKIPEISLSGIAQRDIKLSLRKITLEKEKGTRISNIQHELLLLEGYLDDYLSNALGKLDQDTNIYSRIKDARNSQLHGEFLGCLDSMIFTFFLHLLYL